jgi:hypothetical protein
VKKSKRWRKQLNQLRAMADVPWPARRFRIAPTFGRPLQTERRCMNPVAEARRRRDGWRGKLDLLTFRKPVRQLVLCGAHLELVAATAARRRGYLRCPRCSPVRASVREAVKNARRSAARGVRGR